jgi:hypothetical protein
VNHPDDERPPLPRYAVVRVVVLDTAVRAGVIVGVRMNVRTLSVPMNVQVNLTRTRHLPEGVGANEDERRSDTELETGRDRVADLEPQKNDQHAGGEQCHGVTRPHQAPTSVDPSRLRRSLAIAATAAT